MECAYFQAGRCRSCTWIERPYVQQIADKQAACCAALPMIAADLWEAPVQSAEAGFRNKAKMVVGGSAAQPVLGITDAQGLAVDLSACALYPTGLQAAFAPIREFIRTAGLEPYDVAARCGELKFVLLTHAEHSGELGLRFVLRSKHRLAALQAHLPQLYAALPNLAVVSVNLQPVHQAILEGEEEIILSPRASLPMQLNGMTLHLRPRSFFQTNTQVAAALYRTARDWVARLVPPHGALDTWENAWDLFCGVGGFALHLAPVVQGQVTGIEVSAEAIASAQQSAAELGLENVHFQALAADAFAHGGGVAPVKTPAIVVVNPPRRGLGVDLCRWLENSSVRWVLYSSCNPQSLAQDLARMPSFAPLRAQLFDMFPHTAHGEVLVLLTRNGG